MKSAADTYRRTAKQESKEKWILDNIDYVSKILSTMTIAVRTDEDRENLKSAGVLGLVEAANSFDSSRGVAFRTFAYTRIRGAIIDELRKIAPVSQKILQRIGQIKKAYERLEPPVTPEMLSAATNLEIEMVYRCLEAMRFLKPEDWNDLAGMVHKSWRIQSDNPSHLAEENEIKRMLVDSLQLLPKNERLAITLYYLEDLNLAEIGAVLELSESRVSRVLAAAKFRLQEHLRAKTK